MNDVTISIVSHNQDQLLVELLNDLIKCKNHIEKVIITLNVSSNFKPSYKLYPFEIVVIENGKVKGFSTNHNNAFKLCKSKYYCILNPDVRIYDNPFQSLNYALNKNNIGIVSPTVLNIDGEIDDNARVFPTPIGLVKKLIGVNDGRITYSSRKRIIYSDWVAGMFIYTKTSTFLSLNGFNDKYFLYYEDVDLCLRARKNGLKIAIVTDCSVVHEGQRKSHYSFKYFIWHSMSLIRFFIYHLGRLPK